MYINASLRWYSGLVVGGSNTWKGKSKSGRRLGSRVMVLYSSLSFDGGHRVMVACGIIMVAGGTLGTLNHGGKTENLCEDTSSEGCFRNMLSGVTRSDWKKKHNCRLILLWANKPNSDQPYNSLLQSCKTLVFFSEERKEQIVKNILVTF